MSDKKWFIYVQDHHEGPFTVDEIYSGIEAEKLPREGYVWADGMADWLPISQVEEFRRTAPAEEAMAIPAAHSFVEPASDPEAERMSEPVLESHSQSENFPEFEAAPAPSEPIALESNAYQQAAPQPISTEPTLHSPRELSEPSLINIGAPALPPVAANRAPEPIEPMETTRTNTSIIEVGELQEKTKTGLTRGTARPISVAGSVSRALSGLDKGDRKGGFLKPLGFAVLVVFVLLGLQRLGVLRPIEEKIGSMISTLPELNDISPEEYEDLKKTVKAPLSAGPQVSIALSKADPLSPVFYLATNLPPGARFELYIEGIPHTLLNTLQFSGKLEAVAKKNLAKTLPLRYPDGKPIPRGEYLVYAMEAPTQQPDLVYKELLQLAPIARNLPNHLPQERRIVFSKRIFFGAKDGPKDALYQQRLKEFHDGLVSKAKGEATELLQAAATLESQALVSISNYDRMKRQKIGAPQKQVWSEMNRTWRPVQAQIIQKYTGLSPEQAKENYFHANLVLEFLAIEKILTELHGTHEKLFTTGAAYTQLEGEIMDLRTRFEERKNRWKAALEKAIATPSDAGTGLPVHVELEAPAAMPGVPHPASAPATGGTGNG